MNAVELVEKLGDYAGRGGPAWKRAYAALAVNHYEMLVKALEEAQQALSFTILAGGTALALGDSSSVTVKAQAAEVTSRTALATVADAAQKALEAK